jgi:hypothetical protein
LRRDRFRLDRCEVHLDGPALELRYGGKRIDALDLRYAARHELGRDGLVLCEGEANFLAFGTDPPDSAYLKDEGAGEAPGLWRPVRLGDDDLRDLQEAVAAVRPCGPPDAADSPSLIQALGSVGVWGPRAEALLAAQLGSDRDGDRPSGLRATLHDVALRPDGAGAAARRVLRATSRDVI